MTDVEELLREELRARVAAAEAARTDITPAVRLTELDTRIRRVRLRRRWTGAVLSAAVIAAGVTLPVVLRPWLRRARRAGCCHAGDWHRGHASRVCRRCPW